MAPDTLNREQCDAAIGAFLDTVLGKIHRDDVGPLFGQLATLSTTTPVDATTREQWPEAASCALTDGRMSMSRHYTAAVLPTASSSRIASPTSWM